MGKSMQGKVAVVSGGSEGIGLGVAQAFVDEGARVFITGRRAATLEVARAALGANAVAVQADCAKLADLDRLYETVRTQAGKIDIVVANAAIAGGEPLGAISEEHFDRMFSINVKGTVFTVQKALPLMVEGGSILLMSSIFAFKGTASASIYSATKAAIRSFARNWILDLKSRGIRVNVISPGTIETPGLKALFPDQEVARQVLIHLATQAPLGRVGTPAEIGAAALFLVSEGAAFINGADLQIDGGAAQI